MPPFIRFTQQPRTHANENAQFVYINVAHIMRANYDPKMRILEAELNDGQRTKVRLEGDEADAALKVLQEVSS